MADYKEPDYVKGFSLERVNSDKLAVVIKGVLPTQKHEAVTWFEEEPDRHKIAFHCELRHPIRLPAKPVKTPFEIKKKLVYLAPGEYDEIIFYAGEFHVSSLKIKPTLVVKENKAL